MLAALLLMIASPTGGTSQVAPPAELANHLERRLAVGFATTNRKFRESDFADSARLVAGQLQFDLWMGAQPAPSNATDERPRPRLVAIETWDADGQSRALELGVEAMLVATHVKSRAGQAIRMTEEFLGSRLPAQGGLRYAGLDYQLGFSLYVPASSDDNGASATWERVSTWQVEADERRYPSSISLVDVPAGEYSLTVPDVMRAHAAPHLAQAAIVIADRTVRVPSNELLDGYGTLDEKQRIEFWLRVSEATKPFGALPIDTLLQLAFSEWTSESYRPSSAGPVSRGPSRPDPANPTYWALMRSYERRLDLQTRRHGQPLLKVVTNFVHRWSGDLSPRGVSRYPHPDVTASLKRIEGLTEGSVASCRACALKQLAVLRNVVAPRAITLEEDLPPICLVIPMDLELPNLFRDAPSPRTLYDSLRTYSAEMGKIERKRKAQRFRPFDGVHLLVQTEDGFETVEEIAAADLTLEALYLLLEKAHTPTWLSAQSSSSRKR